MGKEVVESYDSELATTTVGQEGNVPHFVEQFKKSIMSSDPQQNLEVKNNPIEWFSSNGNAQSYILITDMKIFIKELRYQSMEM